MEWPVANEIVQINGESGFVQVVDEIALTSGGLGQGPINFRVRETDFLWTASVAVMTNASGIFRTKIELASEGNRAITGANPCRSDLFWGTAQQPMRHAPKFLPLNAEVNFTFDEISNNAYTVALYLWGKRAEVCQKGACSDPKCTCDRARWGAGRGLYILSTAPAGVVCPAGAGAPGNLKVPDAYHLRLTKACGIAFNNAVATNLWKGTVNRIDPRDERRANVMSAGVRGPGLWGIATAPGRLPSPLTVHKGSQVEQDFADLVNDGVHSTTVHTCYPAESMDDEILEKNG